MWIGTVIKKKQIPRTRKGVEEEPGTAGGGVVIVIDLKGVEEDEDEDEDRNEGEATCAALCYNTRSKRDKMWVPSGCNLFSCRMSDNIWSRQNLLPIPPYDQDFENTWENHFSYVVLCMSPISWKKRWLLQNVNTKHPTLFAQSRQA